jgi:type I restriction enzyme S subunit
VKAGWERQFFGDLCELVRGPFGGSLKKSIFKPAGYAVFEQQHAINDQFDSFRYFIDESKFQEMVRFKVSTGDLIMSCSGTMGRVAKIPENAPEGIINQALLKISPTQGIDPNFLQYWMGSPNFQDQLSATTMGAAIKNVASVKVLKSLSVNLPPLEEQKRIVAVLDAAFEGLTRARTHIETNLQNARELFGNLLDAVFTDCPDHWVKSNLGETCRFVGGSQPPKSNFVTEPGEGLVRLVQIRDYKSDKNIVYVPRSLVRRFCSPDDVMIGRYGPPLFQILRGIDGAYNVALMKAEPDETKISKDFLYLFLRNSRIWRYINDASSRAAGQIGLNKATIEPYPIAYPNLEEQEVVVKRLAEAESDCKQAEALYKTKLQDLDDLRQSLLQRAFAGKLT